MKVIVITGLSGAGKSTALNALEDSGYFTMDNLLCRMGVFLLQNIDKGETELNIDKLALGIDNRAISNSEEFLLLGKTLADSKASYEIVYLEASNEAILNRYNLTRRRHPIEGQTLLESIEKEREIMSAARDKASVIIDTSNLSGKELGKKMGEIINEETTYDTTVHIESFGFKYGVPIDKDLIFDVRVLPNPHYVPNLKPKTGNDKEVYDFVMENENSKELYKKIYEMISFLVPLYKQDNKQHLSIGLGCTGGQHRSVAFVNRLAEELKKIEKIKVLKSHREGERKNWK